MTKNLEQNLNEFSHFACDTDVEEIALSYRHATSAATMRCGIVQLMPHDSHCGKTAFKIYMINFRTTKRKILRLLTMICILWTGKTCFAGLARVQKI